MPAHLIKEARASHAGRARRHRLPRIRGRLRGACPARAPGSGRLPSYDNPFVVSLSATRDDLQKQLAGADLAPEKDSELHQQLGSVYEQLAAAFVKSAPKPAEKPKPEAHREARAEDPGQGRASRAEAGAGTRACARARARGARGARDPAGDRAPKPPTKEEIRKHEHERARRPREGDAAKVDSASETGQELKD